MGIAHLPPILHPSWDPPTRRDRPEIKLLDISKTATALSSPQPPQAMELYHNADNAFLKERERKNK